MSRDWSALARELDAMHERAEALADELDPERSFTARDELTRTLISALDQISRQTNRARMALRVAGKAP